MSPLRHRAQLQTTDQMVEQIAARVEVHDEEEPRRGFKGRVAPLQERARWEVRHHFQLVPQAPPVSRPRHSCFQRYLEREHTHAELEMKSKHRLREAVRKWCYHGKVIKRAIEAYYLTLLSIHAAAKTPWCYTHLHGVLRARDHIFSQHDNRIAPHA